MDMYGDVRKAGEIQLKVLEFGVPIPFEILDNEKHMKHYRKHFMVNTDYPGAMETVHPNKFLANIKPIEEFRHTPVIPIGEKDMLDYKKKIYQRSQFNSFIEVHKDTLYFYSKWLTPPDILFSDYLHHLLPTALHLLHGQRGDYERQKGPGTHQGSQEET